MEQKERVQEVTERTVVEYFDRLDALVSSGTVLYIYGGAAVAVLGSRIRTTMDIDVAEPYSRIDRAEFTVASAKAGLPVNPDADYDSAFREVASGARASRSRGKRGAGRDGAGCRASEVHAAEVRAGGLK